MSHELESVTEPRYHGGGPSTLKAWKFVFLYPSLLLNGSEIHQYGKILMENSAGKDGIMWISLEATEEATRMAHTSVGRWMFTTQVTAHRSQADKGVCHTKSFYLITQRMLWVRNFRALFSTWHVFSSWNTTWPDLRERLAATCSKLVWDWIGIGIAVAV
jgi:hypothetical protein